MHLNNANYAVSVLVNRRYNYRIRLKYYVFIYLLCKLFALASAFDSKEFKKKVITNECVRFLVDFLFTQMILLHFNLLRR